MVQPLRIPLEHASQVGEARRAAVRLAGEVGMDEPGRANVALAATELASNLVKHAGAGEILLQPGPPPGGVHMDLAAIDTGPGMEDVGRCLGDGFSTAGSPGTGLGAVRRLAWQFDVFSRPGSGSVVWARIGSGPRPPEALPFEWGAVCLPKRGEEVCGDAWVVDADGSELSLMVADGLGHGPLAATAAAAAAEAFLGCRGCTPEAILKAAHARLRPTRGAAVVAGTAAAGDGTLVWAGIGNVAGTLISNGSRQGLVSHHGTVGAQARTFHEFRYPWSPGGVLVVHSDGLQARWTTDGYPGLFACHPAVVAAVLYRDHSRGHDDVTVLAVRRRR
jgi:anti-sigma regulatory factor (Ser/Thr protein kinase)